MSMNAPLLERCLQTDKHMEQPSFAIGQHEPTAQHKVVLQ